mmetsp:Transcript_11742/g.33184  ORF Transcript_11742/g.33184 Transcript_11742/m.33184 type:complete len:220 (+) Transcript_11742:24-683(+)
MPAAHPNSRSPDAGLRGARPNKERVLTATGWCCFGGAARGARARAQTGRQRVEPRAAPDLLPLNSRSHLLLCCSSSLRKPPLSSISSSLANWMLFLRACSAAASICCWPSASGRWKLGELEPAGSPPTALRSRSFTASLPIGLRMRLSELTLESRRLSSAPCFFCASTSVLFAFLDSTSCRALSRKDSSMLLRRSWASRNCSLRLSRLAWPSRLSSLPW